MFAKCGAIYSPYHFKTKKVLKLNGKIGMQKMLNTSINFLAVSSYYQVIYLHEVS